MVWTLVPRAADPHRWPGNMTERRIILAVFCLAMIILLSFFATWRISISSLTRRVELAGGFVGSSQPPPWLNPVYDLVSHVDLFLEPYQVILDRDAVADTALPALQDLPHLRLLEFEDLAITPASLGRIRTMNQLETLEFRRCSLPAQGLDGLHKSLPNVRIVEKK